MTFAQYLLAPLAAALLFVLGELAARWWIRRRSKYLVFPPGLRTRLRLDPDALPHLEGETRFEINADGERGNEAPQSGAPGPNVYRVLAAGGSQVEGYFLDQASSWPAVLQEMLNRPDALARLHGSRAHVGSIGRSGVGAEALALVFDRVLPRYRRVQLIIICVGASDVVRWIEQSTPGTLPPVRATDVFMYHPEGPYGWKPSQLALNDLSRRARRRWLRPVNVREGAGAWMGRARAMRARATEILTSTPDPSPMLDHFEHYFVRALSTASAHADRVLVVPQPWFDKHYSPEEASRMHHGGVGQVWRQDVTTFYSFDVVNTLMAAVNARAERVADACGVELFDVSPYLEPSLRTYYDFVHFTPVGARAFAAAIEAAVLRDRIPHSTMPLRAAG